MVCMILLMMRTPGHEVAAPNVRDILADHRMQTLGVMSEITAKMANAAANPVAFFICPLHSR